MTDVGRPPIRSALEGARISELAVRAPFADPASTVDAVRHAIVGDRHGSVSHVVLVRDGRFSGLVRDIDLMAADPDATIATLAIPDPPLIDDDETRDGAARAALSRGESEVVVVRADQSVIGIVPGSSLLAVLAREHADDMARMSGYLHQGDRARDAAEERVLLRFWHRLPWLIVGLAGAIVAAKVVAGFEHTLEQDVMIAYFIPGIVYLAAAVGTQTQAVVIRGLSLGVSTRGVAIRELATGIALGVTLGLLFYPFALLIGTSSQLAVAVSASLAAASALANVIALVVPLSIERLGRDPAFGSGPLATVIQDIMSILVYFAVVSATVQY